jgi:hypothetical protein
MGLYSNTGVLYYLCSWDNLVEKYANSGATPGNVITIKVPVDFSPDGSTIVQETHNAVFGKLGEVNTFDALVPAINSVSNAYLVNMGPPDRTIAYSGAGSDLWRFSNYKRTAQDLVITEVGTSFVKVATTTIIPIEEEGDVIFQVTQGGGIGLVRNIVSYTNAGGFTTINYGDSMPNIAVGDKIEINTNLNKWTAWMLASIEGNYIPYVEKAAASGVASLDSNALVPEAQLPISSETKRGIIEIATQAEVNAGTDDVRSVTPLKLKTYTDGLFIPLTQKGANNGVATLGPTGLLTTSQIPPQTIQRPYMVASQAGMLALAANLGDMCIRTDEDKTYILAGASPSVLANWWLVRFPAQSINYPVTSVNTKTGTVTLDYNDVGAVPTARSITPTPNDGGSGLTLLTGGGDLTANRNIGINLANLVTALTPSFITPAGLNAYNNSTIIPQRTTAITNAINALFVGPTGVGNGEYMRIGPFQIVRTAITGPDNRGSYYSFAVPFSTSPTACWLTGGWQAADAQDNNPFVVSWNSTQAYVYSSVGNESLNIFAIGRA